ncbi:carbohydrate kinase family protein [Patescibacteria group bacterium]|nr:carbohydrate kinase family protein [Patescibacteria group bacterium]
MFKRVVVTGSLSFDHIMGMPTRFADHIMPDKLHVLNVSFIMKRFRREFGGTGGNIAHTLSLLKIPTLLVATAGNDFAPYKKHLRKFKTLDISGIKIYKSQTTANGFVMTDQDDNQIWGFYEGAMKNASKINLEKFLKPGDFLVIAPNDPSAMASYVKTASKLKIPFMFDPAFNIPHFSKNDLRFGVQNAEIVIGNDYENELIQRQLGWTKKQLLNSTKVLITTLGAKGSKINHNGKTISIPNAKPSDTSDPTGAGDCYRAGFMAGYVKGFTLEMCGKMGSISSVYTVEKYGTQTHRFTQKEFIKRYEQNFKEKIDI